MFFQGSQEIGVIWEIDNDPEGKDTTDNREKTFQDELDLSYVPIGGIMGNLQSTTSPLFLLRRSSRQWQLLKDHQRNPKGRLRRRKLQNGDRILYVYTSRKDRIGHREI